MRQKDKKKEKIMAFNIIVARSNPLVMRKLDIRSSYTVKEFTDAVCIALGIAPVDAELNVEGAPGDKLDKLFSENDRIELILPKSEGKNTRAHLDIYVDRTEADKDIPEDSDVPFVSSYTHMNLPADMWDVRDINNILLDLEAGAGAVQTGNMQIYAKDLEYVQKKTINALRRRFAPETAEKEVNNAIKLPMRQLIGHNKLDVLKDICEKNHIYLYAGTRKAEVVERICYSFDRDRLSDLIRDMDIFEYLCFRDYLLDESDTRYDNTIEEDLARLYEKGLITYIPQKGYCIAAELAEIFEGSFSTPKEEKLIKDKYIRTASAVCGSLYGVFDREMFDAVLDGLKADMLTDEERKRAFAELGIRGDINNLTRMDNERYCCNDSKLKQSVIERVIARRNGSKQIFIPDKEFIKNLIKTGPELGKKSRESLALLITKHRYYHYYGEMNTRDILKAVARSIHWGESTEDTVKIVEDSLYRHLQWQSRSFVNDVKQQITKIVETEEKNIPLVGLNGFSLNNCPKEMKEYYLMLKEKQEAEMQARIRKAAALKKRY